MTEEFEDVELPPEDPNEWKECPSCTNLKTAITALRLDLEVAQMHLDQSRAQIFELNKDAEYTIQVLKERKVLQDQLKECRKQTLIDVQKMIMGNAYNFLNKNAEFICKRIQNMML